MTGWPVPPAGCACTGHGASVHIKPVRSVAGNGHNETLIIAPLGSGMTCWNGSTGWQRSLATSKKESAMKQNALPAEAYEACRQVYHLAQEHDEAMSWNHRNGGIEFTIKNVYPGVMGVPVTGDVIVRFEVDDILRNEPIDILCQILRNAEAEKSIT